MIASTSATHVATSTTSRAATEAGTLLLRGPSPLPSPENKLLPVHPNHATPTSELITYSQLPVWLQDNIHIHQHYRKLSNSTLACVSSWTYLHNESVNIFSHLFPAVILLSVIRHLCCEVLPTMYPLATGGDCLVLAIFLAAAVVCFGVSAGFHTFLCHSERVATVWLHMDFLGIVLMIEGCFVSGIYVGFYCEPELRKMYWGMILLLGLLCGIIVSSPKFQGQEWRAFRLGSFIATGLSAIAPIAHGVYLFGFEQMMKQSGVPYYLLEGVLVVLGAWIYNNRLPEALSPGSFDIWGSSHQIFHILVVVAMGVHFVGIAKAYDYNYSHQRCTTVV